MKKRAPESKVSRARTFESKEDEPYGLHQCESGCSTPSAATPEAPASSSRAGQAEPDPEPAVVSWTAVLPEEPEHQRAAEAEDGTAGATTPAVDNDHDHHSGDDDTPEAT
jgi:hypothetical protein